MNIVPIVFAFDNNLSMPASVCIFSLLKNAHETTVYDIFILHHKDEVINMKYIDAVMREFPRHRCQLRKVDDTFNNSFEIRGITTPAYYRLLIPQLIPEYDKVLYADVDIIFRSDLSDLYQMCLGNSYLAATYDWGMIFGKDGQKHISQVEGLKQGEYIQSGFLLINSVKIRQDNLIPKFIEEAKKNYKFQDQDILNVVCGINRVVLPIKYNMTDYAFYYLMNEPERIEAYFSKEQIEESKKYGTLHYNGHKPWKKWSVNFDIWWEYYRKSPVFDEKFYFDFYNNRLNELDRLSLMKRIKILVRYFVYGRGKNA